jgi:hypothetical protein
MGMLAFSFRLQCSVGMEFPFLLKWGNKNKRGRERENHEIHTILILRSMGKWAALTVGVRVSEREDDKWGKTIPLF